MTAYVAQLIERWTSG